MPGGRPAPRRAVNDARGRTHGSGNGIVPASTSGLKRVDGGFRLSGPSFAALNNILPIHRVCQRRTREIPLKILRGNARISAGQ